MPKENVSLRQAGCIIIMFIFGSSVVMGVSTESGQDSWLCLLLAQAYILPIILIYSRILSIFPEKDIFEIVETLLGKLLGKVIILLTSWYSLHVAALVLRNFSEFIEISVLPETPQLVTIILMILVVIYMAKSGIETLGKWSIMMLSVVTFVVISTFILSINKMDVENMLPVMENSFGKIADDAYKLFTFPFAETVVLLGLASSFKKMDSPYKLYIYSTFIAAVILLLVLLRNLLLLGPVIGKAEYFTSYTAVRAIHVSDFFARIEGGIAMNFILAGIVKISVCLIVATKGTAKLFEIRSYKNILFPVGMLVVALSVIIYKNIMEMFNFLKIYAFYAIPFQILIPIFIWIVAEIKTRKDKEDEIEEASF